jgi:CRISPR-associated protein Cas5d
MNGNLVSVRVWGDFACFTRPEMKVERVSYPIMTPAAGRGILEAIFWEPEVMYLIHTIRVVKKGQWVSFLRNEVTKVVSVRNALKWMKDPSQFDPICAGGGARDGTQRNMLALEGVEYIITAEMSLTEIGRRSEQKLVKYADEFRRRAAQGKCFHRPGLGMREFAADFEWEPDPQAALERRAKEAREDKDWRNIWPHEDLGLMLYDLFDYEDRRHGFKWMINNATESHQLRTGRASPLKNRPTSAGEQFDGRNINPKAGFFNAVVENAALECRPDRIHLIRQEGQV